MALRTAWSFGLLAAVVGTASLPLAAQEVPRGAHPAVPAVVTAPPVAVGPDWPLLRRSPALAPVPAPREGLTSEQITEALARRGFVPAGEVRRRGDYFVVVADGPDGGRFDLVVHGTSGAIDGVRRRPKP